MADAATLDLGSKAEEDVARREDAAPAAVPAPPPRPSRDPLSDAILSSYGDLVTARKKEREGLEAKAEGLAPRLDAATRAVDTRVQQIAQNPPPPPPALPPPPSRNLSTFLSPREGESAEASVQKLIQAIGLFAGGVGGLARGDARGSLAAFTGAMKGWNEGDIERGDRAFKDWEAKTSTALKAWETERTAYRDWLEAGNLSVEQMLSGLKLQAAQHDNKQAVLAFDSGRIEEGIKFLQQQQVHADAVENTRARLVEAHESAMRVDAHRRWFEDFHERKLQAEKDAVKDAASAYDNPVSLAMLGQAYFLNGPKGLPPRLVTGKTGPVIMPKIIAAAAEWARSQGLDPMSSPAIQADIKEAQKALGETKKREAVAEVAVGTFERHMDQLVLLSKDVPRSEWPIINKAIVEGQRSVQGSPAAQAYVAIAYEAGQEFAKVSVGTAQGDASSRADARNAIGPAMTHEQLLRVRVELGKTAESRMAQYRATEARLLDTINSPKAPGVERPSALPKDKPAGPKRIRIFNTADPDERAEVNEGSPWQAKYPGWEAEK